MNRPIGPVCQSCAMPLHAAEDHGTEANGRMADDYCRFCYQRGAFVNPTATMTSMIDFCARKLTERGMPFAEAQTLMTNTLPHLRRWRSPAA